MSIPESLARDIYEKLGSYNKGVTSERQPHSGQPSGSNSRGGSQKPCDDGHNHGHDQPGHQQSRQGPAFSQERPRTIAEQTAHDAAILADLSPYRSSYNNRPPQSGTDAFNFHGMATSLDPQGDDIPATAGPVGSQRDEQGYAYEPAFGPSYPPNPQPPAPAGWFGLSGSTTTTEQGGRPGEPSKWEEKHNILLLIMKKNNKYEKMGFMLSKLGKDFDAAMVYRQLKKLQREKRTEKPIRRRTWTEEDIKKFKELEAKPRSNMSVRDVARALVREEDDVRAYWEKYGDRKRVSVRKYGEKVPEDSKGEKRPREDDEPKHLRKIAPKPS